jgi:hypothetical protein
VASTLSSDAEFKRHVKRHDIRHYLLDLVLLNLYPFLYLVLLPFLRYLVLLLLEYLLEEDLFEEDLVEEDLIEEDLLLLDVIISLSLSSACFDLYVHPPIKLIILFKTIIL